MTQKVLFDCMAIQPSQGKYHGGGEYAKSVLYHLLEKGYGNSLTCFYDKNEWIDEKLIDFLKSESVEIIGISSDEEIQNLLNNALYYRLYSPLPYKYYKFDLTNIEFIYTMHGLRDLEMPTDKYEFFLNTAFLDRVRWIIKNVFPGFYKNLLINRHNKIMRINNSTKNDKLLVDSLHSKYSIINFFKNINHNNIYFYYPPMKKIQDFNLNDDYILKTIGIESKDYILMVSGNRWIKNPCRALLALDKIDMKKKVIVTGTNYNTFKFLKLKNKNRFFFIDYVKDADLEILYKNAFVLLYPTLNEGFGYPPLEAMKYGTYVISSAVSSITEIFGDALIYFNPYLIDEIENRVTMLLLDEDVRNDLSERIDKKCNEIFKKQADMINELCRTIMD